MDACRVSQVQAAFAAGAILIFGGWVDAKKTVGYVDWSLLLLIGSALGLSKGIVNSGLADYVGGAIRDSGISAEGSLFVLYAFTMVSGRCFLACFCVDRHASLCCLMQRGVGEKRELHRVGGVPYLDSVIGVSNRRQGCV